MGTYLYKGKTATGKEEQGVLEAPSKEEAQKLLRDRRMQVKELKYIGEKATLFSPLVALYKYYFQRISIKDKVFFTRQIATIINAGIPLLKALYIQKQQTRNKRFCVIIEELIADLEGGISLSESIAKHPDVFDTFYLSLVRAGEVSGSVDESLRRLADQLEGNYKLLGKLKSALVLPSFIFVAMIGVVVLMLVYVVPQLSTLFTEEGVEMPLPTRIMIFMSNALLSYWFVIIIVLFVAFSLFTYYFRTPQGIALYDTLVTKVPIFGPLLQKIYIDRFSRNLGIMLEDGVPITTALNVVAETMGNTHYSKSVTDLIPQIEHGRSLTKATSADSRFPFIAVQMINVGEESGELDAMLMKVADFLEEEIDNTVKNLATLLEPLVIVIMGFGVVFLAVAILGPIYGLVNVI
jgi:type IV pilus assembly protein PilC